MSHSNWRDMSTFCALEWLMIRRGHGKVRLWPYMTGALTSCPHLILLLSPSLPSRLLIRVIWKTFLSTGGWNKEIRWAVRWLLGLLPGTGSSQTPLILLCWGYEGCRACICMCALGIWGSVFILACDPECMRYFSHAGLSQVVTKNKTSNFIKQMCASQNTYHTYLSMRNLQWHNNP